MEETKFIGGKKIKETKVMGEKTPGGLDIIQVTYEDLSIEHLSKIMFDEIVSDEACDATKLREKRVVPVVSHVLSLLREWGITIGETEYLAAMLNKSIDYNSSQALLHLVSQYMQKPNSLDGVDLLTIDRILKTIPQTVAEAVKSM